MKRFEDRMKTGKKSLMQSRTAQHWLLYMDMMDILLKFLKAERTGQWELHFESMYDMLPYLAASDHNMHAKSVYIFLRNMAQLQQHHPRVYVNIFQGYHVVRRTDRFWAGIALDVVIEQMLMRSVKSIGGLTRGRC